MDEIYNFTDAEHAANDQYLSPDYRGVSLLSSISKL